MGKITLESNIVNDIYTEYLYTNFIYNNIYI